MVCVPRLKIMHNLHHLHKLFIFNAQPAVQVVLFLVQTDTTVHRGKFMSPLCSAKIIYVLKRQAFQSEPDSGRQSPECSR